MQDIKIEGKLGDYLAYYENIVAAILGEAPLAVTGRSVLPSIRILDAALRSAATGSVVMPEVGPREPHSHRWLHPHA
jgi:predicted dehydrogenase